MFKVKKQKVNARLLFTAILFCIIMMECALIWMKFNGSLTECEKFKTYSSSYKSNLNNWFWVHGLKTISNTIM